MSLILASTSKYRRELLEKLKIPFECQKPNVDEDQYKDKGLAASELALVLAQAKAQAVAQQFPDAVVIGSDQVAALDDLILDKPSSHENAVKQLRLMSGRSHQLHTGVALIHNGNVETFINVTTLFMHKVDDAAIERYLKQDEPYDCAGSYKIESLGVSLFSKIETTDFNAIVGLPLMELASKLRVFGYQIP